MIRWKFILPSSFNCLISSLAWEQRCLYKRQFVFTIHDDVGNCIYKTVMGCTMHMAQAWKNLVMVCRAIIKRYHACLQPCQSTSEPLCEMHFKVCV
jgi:hypothetical protein